MGDACPNCGYSAINAVENFDFGAPTLQPILDVEGVLGSQRIGNRLVTLSDFYPDVFPVVCTLSLEPGTDAREFGYWLLNASPVETEEDEKRRRNTILLVIDVANHQASVTLGYEIEPFLGDSSIRQCLEGTAEQMAQGDFTEAVIRFIDSVHITLDHAYEGAQQKLAQVGGAR